MFSTADMYEHNFPALRQREGSEAPLPLGSELHIAGPSATPVSKPPTTDEEEKVVHKGERAAGSTQSFS